LPIRNGVRGIWPLGLAIRGRPQVRLLVDAPHLGKDAYVSLTPSELVTQVGESDVGPNQSGTQLIRYCPCRPKCTRLAASPGRVLIRGTLMDVKVNAH
jgi:hypothetical protein